MALGGLGIAAVEELFAELVPCKATAAPVWPVRTIAAAVCLGDDAVAALAASLTAAAHATADSGALAAHATRVTTALTRALAHHP